MDLYTEEVATETVELDHTRVCKCGLIVASDRSQKRFPSFLCFVDSHTLLPLRGAALERLHSWDHEYVGDHGSH